MKIVVPVKIAAHVDEDMTLQDGDVDPDALEWDVNEWDLVALEAALELVEADGGEVVVVSVGGDEVREGLLTALAMGADRSVHVTIDDEASKLDALAVSRLLQAVVAPEEPDLVLCGVQTSDGASAATGIALAALLDFARVAVIRNLAISDGIAAVERELEGGVVEKLEVPLPALLTIQTGMNEPRYANLRGIRQAKEKPYRAVMPSELGFDDAALAAAAGSRRVALETVTRGSQAEMLEGDASEIAAQIASIVKGKVSG